MLQLFSCFGKKNREEEVTQMSRTETFTTEPINFSPIKLPKNQSKLDLNMQTVQQPPSFSTPSKTLFKTDEASIHICEELEMEYNSTLRANKKTVKFSQYNEVSCYQADSSISLSENSGNPENLQGGYCNYSYENDQNESCIINSIASDHVPIEYLVDERLAHIETFRQYQSLKEDYIKLKREKFELKEKTQKLEQKHGMLSYLARKLSKSSLFRKSEVDYDDSCSEFSSGYESITD